MIHATKYTLRVIGDLANLAMAMIFIVATLVFHDRMHVFIAAGGGFAKPSDLGLAWVARQAQDPALLSHVISWSAAWGCGIAALGCAWMSILGLRWTYHALLRWIDA